MSLWLGDGGQQLGLLESRCLEEAGPEASEEEVLPPGAGAGASGVQCECPLAPASLGLHTQISGEGRAVQSCRCCRGVCDEAGAVQGVGKASRN